MISNFIENITAVLILNETGRPPLKLESFFDVIKIQIKFPCTYSAQVHTYAFNKAQQ